MFYRTSDFRLQRNQANSYQVGVVLFLDQLILKIHINIISFIIFGQIDITSDRSIGSPVAVIRSLVPNGSHGNNFLTSRAYDIIKTWSGTDIRVTRLNDYDVFSNKLVVLTQYYKVIFEEEFDRPRTMSKISRAINS